MSSRRAGAVDDGVDAGAAFGQAQSASASWKARPGPSTSSEISSCRRWRSKRRSVWRITSTGMMRVTIECFSRSRAAQRGKQIPRPDTLSSSRKFSAACLELRKIVAVGLDQVAHALDRVGLEAGALVAVGHLRRHQRFAAAGLGIGGVKPLQGMGHAGAQFGEVAQFLLRQVDLPEQRIGEDLVQFGKEAVLVGGGEVAQVEVIGLRPAAAGSAPSPAAGFALSG